MVDSVMCGECSSVLRGMDADSVDLTVTSPPYDNLRGYNGYSFDFDAVATQLYRVTKPGGVVVWVVGDSTVNGSESGASFRQALSFKDIGFNLHDTMIFSKYASTWNETSRRYRQNFEYMFVFSRGRVKSFNPIRDVIVKNMSPRKIKNNRNSLSPTYSMYTPKSQYTVRNNIMHYAVGGARVDHPAPFPERLASDHVVTWSNEGDTVLDPFAGSGTTLIAARKANRRYIGIEISSEYVQTIHQRMLTEFGK